MAIVRRNIRGPKLFFGAELQQQRSVTAPVGSLSSTASDNGGVVETDAESEPVKAKKLNSRRRRSAKLRSAREAQLASQVPPFPELAPSGKEAADTFDKSEHHGKVSLAGAAGAAPLASSAAVGSGSVAGGTNAGGVGDVLSHAADSPVVKTDALLATTQDK